MTFDTLFGKPVVYSKQHNEPITPLTVRIDWLPDSSIKPVKFWTRDGCGYDITYIIDKTPLALLKDRGVGLRFRVKAAMAETLEPYPDIEYNQHETYLYLTDNWFCGKNIVDDRYVRSHKEYVTVTLDVFPNAEYELVYFWAKQSRYKVEKTISIEPRGSYRAGGVGLWHKVEARLVNTDNDDDSNPAQSIRREAGLYFEVNKWFIVTTDNSSPSQ